MSTSAAKDELISDLEALSAKRLTPCLALVIEETADYLFTLSTSSRLDQKNQDQCYQAFVVLQTASKTIVTEMVAAMSSAFQLYRHPITSDEKDTESEIPGLALIPLEEFEDTLAIEKIVKAGTERFWLELESIMFRLAVGLGSEPESVELPVSPRTICSAYRQSLQNIDFPRAFLVDADSAFVRKLLPELAGIYHAINQYLSSLNLLPNIEAELQSTGSRLLIQVNMQRDSHPPSSTSKDPTNSSLDGAGFDEADEGTRLQPLPSDQMIHSSEWVDSFVIDALAGRSTLSTLMRSTPTRQTQPEELLKASGGRLNFAPSRIMPPIRDEASGARLLKNAENLLTSNQSSTLEIESESLRIAHEIATLRRENPTSRYTIDDLIEAMGFTPKAAVYDRLVEAFKISSGLLDYVFHRTAPPSDMGTPLANMELCFLELSLVDQRFLVDGEHPGRLLVDRVADLVTLLPRGKQRYLEGFIDIVSELNTRFDGSPIALEYAARAITDLSAALISQQRRNRDRLIARENAADRIDGARATVVSAIEQILINHKQSTYLSQVITKGLFDQWVVDVLRGAPTSDIQDYLRALIRFMGNGEVQPDLSFKLTDLVSFLGNVTEQRPEVLSVLEDCAESRDQITLETVGKRRSWGVSLDLAPEELDQVLIDRPRLSRAVRSVQKLSLDTWFMHQIAGEHRYLQIVWVNRHNTRFVLSDERGIKQRDLSILQMASELGRSLRTLTTIEQLSLVEQTLFSKLSETKDDLSQAFVAGSKDHIDGFTHDIERALRRSRRVGITESAVSFSVPPDLPRELLKESITGHGLDCRCVEKLTSSAVCAIVTSTKPEGITKVVSLVLNQETVADLQVELIDPESIPDAVALVNRLMQQSTASGSDSASPGEQSSIAQKSLDDAIEQAFIRLDSLAQEIRLQPIVRVSTKAGAPPESSYLVVMQDAAQENAPPENQFRQRDIRIATNLIELREACRLLQVTESTRVSSPHLMLSLCHEICLHPTALDRILTLISEHTVGTSQLSFLIPDSVPIRESIICHRLTDALRSIGCHIVIENYNPARSGSEAIYELHASDVVLEPNFWERAAQNEPWASVLPQIISDVHHILGHTVTIRDPLITDKIESSGIDYVERYSAVALSPTEFLNHLEAPSHFDP